MKKKIGAILTACAMACLSLIGCNNDPVADFVMPEGGFNNEAQIEIKFYHTMGQSLRSVLQSYIEQFNVLYPNIKVVEDQIGSYEDVRDQIVTEISAGNQPNLAYCYPDHVALFNQSNAVLSLNGFLSSGEYKDMTVTNTAGEEKLGFTKEQEDSFIQAYLQEGYQFGDGKNMYTLPFSKSTEVLYYNMKYFEDNNLSVPTTWDEMEQVCARIKELNPEITPFGYDSEANWFITMCEQYGSPYTTADGTGSDHFLFDNATNRAFVERLKGWYDKGYFITREINKGYTSDKFRTGASVMCIGSSAGAKNQIPDKGDNGYPFQVGIAPIPQANVNNPKVISQGPSVCIFKNGDPQKVLASWLLAKFLTTNIGFQAKFSDVSGYVPVLTTVMEDATYKNNIENENGYERTTYRSAKVCMEQVSYYYTSPAFVGSSKARDEVGRLMQAVFTNSKTIDQAFKDAIEECKYFAG